MASSVTALAALLRFADLGRPRALVFDEVYYARGAYSLLKLGYEGKWGTDNGHFAQGDFSDLTTSGDYVVHPMVGKLLIAAGMKIAGTGPFGYRFAGAFLGTMMANTSSCPAPRFSTSFSRSLWSRASRCSGSTDGARNASTRSILPTPPARSDRA